MQPQITDQLPGGTPRPLPRHLVGGDGGPPTEE
jgi:hypothetical protein